MIALLGLLIATAAPQDQVYRPARQAAPVRAPVTVPDDTLSDEEVRALAASYLGGIDTPVTADQWRALGPRAIPLLEEVVSNRDALPSRRAAALAALAALGGARAGVILVEAARSDDEPFAVRAAAIHGASHVLGSRALVRELRPVLEAARDPAARAAAAEVLVQRAPRSACAAVRAQADREGEGRPRFERALGRCASKE